MANLVERTLVLDFGESSSSSASGLIKAEWDDTLNVDDQGQTISRYLPGSDIYLLVQYQSSITLRRVAATAGSVAAMGRVALSREQEIGFADQEDKQSLSYIPASGLQMSWKGRGGSGLKIDGLQVSMSSGFPCLAVCNYKSEFQRFKVSVPALDLAQDEEFPLRVYIYYLEQV